MVHVTAQPQQPVNHLNHPKNNAAPPFLSSTSALFADFGLLSHDTDEMNWAHDNAQLSDGDLRAVFKYEPQQSTVIRVLASHNVSSCSCTDKYRLTVQWRVEISSRETEKQWSQWIEEVSKLTHKQQISHPSSKSAMTFMRMMI
jgi:hypothetical protein